jgi:4-amino-4-deoxy-L-arabinose transferase-like glycosyltransferase
MMKKLFTLWFPIGFILIILLAIVIRFSQLTSVPPSLYWEEAALGYDAFSILKTGKDHHGHPFPVVAFESFGDYKPSLYFYAIVPFIAVLNNPELAVRMPSATAGVLIVIGVGCIAFSLFKKNGTSLEKACLAQLLAMLVTAVSPWAIQFSRAGWEVNLATCLLLWGVYFGIFHETKQKWLKLLAYFLLGLSMYTYHAARIIAPFLALGVMLLDWQEQGLPFGFDYKKLKKHQNTIVRIFITGCFFLLLVAPLLVAAKNKETQQRFAETSIFADGQQVILSNRYRELAHNIPLSNLFFHRYVFATELFIANYLKHFDLSFLFVSGDQNLRHSIQFFGLLYPVEAFFLAAGFITLLQQKNKYTVVLLFWLLIGILPAALTKATPHALRILPTLPVFLVLVTLGILRISDELLAQLKKKKILKIEKFLIGGVVLLYLIQFSVFWRYYYFVYPKIAAGEWQYGYKQLISSIAQLRVQQPTQQFFITREYGRPAMYYWFFTQTDPRQVQAAEQTAKKDQGEFLEFENLKFINTVNEAQTGIVASSEVGYQQLVKEQRNVKELTTIKNLQGKTVWVVYSLQ